MKLHAAVPLGALLGALAVAWLGCGSSGATTGGAGAAGGAGGAVGGTTGSTTTGSSTTSSGVPAMPMFETDIVPIFNKSCGAGDNSCHSEVAYAATKDKACRGWLSLKDTAIGSKIYGGAMDGTPTGCPDMPLHERLTQLPAWEECGGVAKKYIVPCDVDASYLFDKIDDGPYCGDPPSDPMPLGKKMDPGEKETIRAWILAGAPRVGGGGVDCNGTDGGTDAGMIGSPPKAEIWHPGDMETRPANMDMPFIGSGTDPEDGTLPGSALVWTSNLSGMIGTGMMFNAPLSAGTHVITLTVTDSDKNTATASITLFIQ